MLDHKVELGKGLAATIERTGYMIDRVVICASNNNLNFFVLLKC